MLAGRLTGTLDGRPVVIDADDGGVVVQVAALRTAWDALVNEVLAEATLKRPALPAGYITQGKSGIHSEHLSYLLGEMQGLARAHPGAQW